MDTPPTRFKGFFKNLSIWFYGSVALTFVVFIDYCFQRIELITPVSGIGVWFSCFLGTWFGFACGWAMPTPPARAGEVKFRKLKRFGFAFFTMIIGAMLFYHTAYRIALWYEFPGFKYRYSNRYYEIDRVKKSRKTRYYYAEINPNQLVLPVTIGLTKSDFDRLKEQNPGGPKWCIAVREHQSASGAKHILSARCRFSTCKRADIRPCADVLK